MVYSKNGVYHIKASGKSSETVISDFFIFETLSQRFFWLKVMKKLIFYEKDGIIFIFFGHLLVYLIKLLNSTFELEQIKKDPFILELP